MAARMVETGTVAATPEALDDWLAGEPALRQELVEGGYGTAFTAADLHPLLLAMVQHAGGRVPEPDSPYPDAVRHEHGRGRGFGMALMIAALLVAVAVVVSLMR